MKTSRGGFETRQTRPTRQGTQIPSPPREGTEAEGSGISGFGFAAILIKRGRNLAKNEEV